MEEGEQVAGSSEGVHELQGEYLGLIREIEGPEEIFE
jgi:hypothetical protein